MHIPGRIRISGVSVQSPSVHLKDLIRAQQSSLYNTCDSNQEEERAHIEAAGARQWHSLCVCPREGPKSAEGGVVVGFKVLECCGDY